MTSVAQGQQVTRYEYDLLGRLTKVITPDGAETAYAYDALGNIIGETDPLGNTTQFAYTPENLLAQVTYANGATQRLDYDLVGNVTAETDGEGYTKHYKYDKVNRLTAVVDEAGNTTSYKYDALDNIAQVTDAMKHVTKYTYDKNGNLLTETDALGNTVTYAYTPEGWLRSVTKADGTVMTFAYDKTGNLLAQNTGENQNIENSYNEIGQVTTVKNSEGTITYQYNQQGYLVSVTNVNGDVVSYTYDEYGNKTSMTYPDGRAVRYTYDSMNRMTSVTGLDGEVTTYAYDAAGRRVETASRTLTTEYRYDVVGSLVEQSTTGSSNIRFQYTYNLNGYITGEVRTENGAAVESLYTYDPLGELTGFTQSTGYGEQYAYDKAGNMTAKTITGTDGQTVALKMTYNKGNQLVSMTNGKDKLTYGYDQNGSMVQKVLSSKQYGKLTDTYAYNSLDQLVSYIGYDGYQQRFTYDANGMRLSKSEYGNSNRSTLEELLRGDIAGLPEVIQPAEEVPEGYEWATTEYLYDITQEYYQVIEQTTTKDNTTTTTAYAYGVERIAAYDTNATTQYIYDGRGSVVQTISAPAAGTSVSAALPQVEVQSYSYTAFGEQMDVKVSGFGYNAEDYDAGTGMINLRMRQYESVLNRFCQYDMYPSNPLVPSSINRYLYTYNSPISYFDTNGMVAVALGKALASVWEKNFVGVNTKSAQLTSKKVVNYITKTSSFGQGLTRKLINGHNLIASVQSVHNGSGCNVVGKSQTCLANSSPNNNDSGFFPVPGPAPEIKPTPAPERVLHSVIIPNPPEKKKDIGPREPPIEIQLDDLAEQLHYTNDETEIRGIVSSIEAIERKLPMHQAVVFQAAYEVQGSTNRSETKIEGAGRTTGKYGYPDIMAGQYVWEVKPDSSYGHITGPLQMHRYTFETGYEAGNALNIEPIPYRNGFIYVTNGSKVTGDKGVLYYKYIPNQNGLSLGKVLNTAKVVVTAGVVLFSIPKVASLIGGMITLFTLKPIW